ncbi:hypothetical protein F4782DRAFT_544258 [Xylaria castorea]|nr:hypothetical protein F4782DRAFT_544258 [Xylaria castorea]
MANPDERKYCASVVCYISSVFHECLDEEAGKATRQDRKPAHPVKEMMNSNGALTSAFENEANYIAHCCQTAYRFKALRKIVERTGFTEDGLLDICRNYPLVDRYNKAMAVGLRHNHDISLILTKTKGLAVRLVLAAEALQQRHESGVLRRQIPNPPGNFDEGCQPGLLPLARVSDGFYKRIELVILEFGHPLLGNIPTNAYACRGELFQDDQADGEFQISLSGLSECQNWARKLRRPHEYVVPIFQGSISNDHQDEHSEYFKLCNFFLSRAEGDITDIWSTNEASLSRRLRFYDSNVSLLRKSAKYAYRDAKLWASRSESHNTADIEFPVGEGDYDKRPGATAEHYQIYTALFYALQNAVRNSYATRDSSPFVQRHKGFYQQIRRLQDSPLYQYPTLSREEIQGVAKAQPRHAPSSDDMLAQHWDSEIPFPRQGQGQVTQGPQMLVDISPSTGFMELRHPAASNYTLNSLQNMALHLACRVFRENVADPDSAGGTGKSRIINAIKAVFAARGQSRPLQITGTSGSAVAQVGGTTQTTPSIPGSEKWAYKQKLVLVIDEVGMLGGTTLYDINCHLQSRSDCLDKLFGGIPAVLLIRGFYRFAPVRETSLLVSKMMDTAFAPVS